MKHAALLRRGSGGIVTELLIAAIVFGLLLILVVDFVLRHQTTPSGTLLTEPAPPRLISID
ncbi:hypothetical protein [Tropicimonas sp. S265A]|uniref:hypothetical protein n=1 Tax=Tropicimonas sp. S265A TaxID=3415134 RepID=UPI003C7A3305